MTIVGYTFNTENYCVDCMREIAKQGTAGEGSATIWSDGGQVESILTEWALLRGIDREDEGSFDSSEFPKRVYQDQMTPGERCGRCRMKLHYENDPFDEEFWKDFERFAPNWSS